MSGHPVYFSHKFWEDGNPQVHRYFYVAVANVAKRWVKRPGGKVLLRPNGGAAMMSQPAQGRKMRYLSRLSLTTCITSGLVD